MGYTGGDDTLTQVELSFPTLQSAIRYAERQGLTYMVQTPPRQKTGNGRSQRADEKQAYVGKSTHAFSGRDPRPARARRPSGDLRACARRRGEPQRPVRS